jgi:hypothetical protein
MEETMGLFSGLLGNVSEVDVEDVEENLGALMAEGETIERAYKLIRDMFIFTNRRLILVDKQGMTGKKIEYHCIPYKSITHFTIESAGHFDMESELKIFISGTEEPIQKTFSRGSNIVEVQKALATGIFSK